MTFSDIFSYGAKFVNEKGEDLWKNIRKRNWKTRRIISNVLSEEIYLIEDRDSNFKAKCDDLYDNNIHKDKPIKVTPMAHFMMGGVKLNHFNGY